MLQVKGLSENLIKGLLEAVGPSGNEEEAAKIAARQLKLLSRHLVTDHLGSCVARIGPHLKDASTVLIMGHIDEVGFIVRRVEKSGAVRVIPVGGIDPTTLYGQRIKLLTRKGKLLHGAFHYPATAFDQRKVPTDVTKGLVADFGFDSLKEATRQITPGDPIVFDVPFRFVGKDKAMSKAVDDRLGVLAVIGAAKLIKAKKPKVNVYAGFSVQEEVGLRGGKTIADTINPDFAIICDVSNALDVTGSPEIGKIGAGVQFRPMDAATIQPAVVSHWYKDLLDKHKVPHQPYISPGGTDAGAVQLARSGVPVVQIGLVAREIHSASTLFSLQDLITATKAIALAALDLDEAKIASFKKKWN